jgi:hypothetical protein
MVGMVSLVVTPESVRVTFDDTVGMVVAEDLLRVIVIVFAPVAVIVALYEFPEPPKLIASLPEIALPLVFTPLNAYEAFVRLVATVPMPALKLRLSISEYSLEPVYRTPNT